MQGKSYAWQGNSRQMGKASQGKARQGKARQIDKAMEDMEST
jgi:hypothetical protein